MYEGELEGDENYFYDESHPGSFEQDLAQALDAGVRQTVNDALAKAITPLKHQLSGFAQQQGLLEGQSNPPTKSIHAEACEKLTSSLMTEHPYSMSTDPPSDPSEDSEGSSSHSPPMEDSQPLMVKEECSAAGRGLFVTTPPALLLIWINEVV
ncbi:hypothetical protein NDU88_005963 [Pleurodeles waltl]|uniref:Uncharacterized protein n=1 Tax=Pleurodeles waltl TaxID=8319 RepID=A0AAV7VLJ8_PLEWA|nr:hypothetical protein NDU88_005963 [Pleurodeles waltl]